MLDPRICCLAVGIVGATAWPATAAATDTWTEPHPGIRHLRRDTSNQKIDVVLADLTRPEVRVRATKHEDRGMTVSGFADLYGCAVAINGDFWQWEVFTTSGLSVGDGVLWPDEKDNTTEGFIAVGVDNFAMISPPPEVLEAPEAWMSDVVGGRPLVVENGIALDPTDCAPHFCEKHPRTAVGLTADGNTLILAVIDGRTSIAAGMTSREVGDLMVEMGADIALNFDGGGSTAMWVDGDGGIVNVPSDGSERVVANHFGIEIVAPIGTLRGTVASATGTPIAGAQVQVGIGASATTDAAGAFELVDTAAGDTVITTTHPEWATDQQTLWVSAQEITEVDLVLAAAPPPPPAPADTGDEEDSGEPEPHDDGGDEGSSGDATGYDPAFPSRVPDDATAGCGCSANAGPRGAAILLLLLGAFVRRGGNNRPPPGC